MYLQRKDVWACRSVLFCKVDQVLHKSIVQYLKLVDLRQFSCKKCLAFNFHVESESRLPPAGRRTTAIIQNVSELLKQPRERKESLPSSSFRPPRTRNRYLTETSNKKGFLDERGEGRRDDRGHSFRRREWGGGWRLRRGVGGLKCLFPLCPVSPSTISCSGRETGFFPCAGAKKQMRDPAAVDLSREMAPSNLKEAGEGS